MAREHLSADRSVALAVRDGSYEADGSSAPSQLRRHAIWPGVLRTRREHRRLRQRIHVASAGLHPQSDTHRDEQQSDGSKGKPDLHRRDVRRRRMCGLRSYVPIGLGSLVSSWDGPLFLPFG